MFDVLLKCSMTTSTIWFFLMFGSFNDQNEVSEGTDFDLHLDSVWSIPLISAGLGTLPCRNVGMRNWDPTFENVIERFVQDSICSPTRQRPALPRLP